MELRNADFGLRIDRRAHAGADLAATADAPANPQSAVRDPQSEIVPRLWNALREVMDPEIPISVVDLGLIYDIRFRDGTAEVDFSYTAIACPCAHFIQWDIAERLQQEPDVTDVKLTEVWNPGWTKARVTADGRRRLKEMGVSL
jgi:metal-sulfur cluster biosynthetic enzyme